MSLSETEKSIIDSSPVDIYVASNMPYEYPYKLVKPKHASQRIVNTADKVIMDSGIGDNISNREVLNCAEELDTDYIVAKDYLNDLEKTTKSIREFWHQYERHDYTGKVLIPLQEDFTKHYYELDKPEAVLLGGIKNFSPNKQVDLIKEFVSNVSDDVYIHALGMGMSPVIVNFIKQNPNAINSIDCSTPEKAPISNKICDASMKQVDYETAKGKKSSVMRYRMAQLSIIQLNYVMTNLCTMDMYNDSENKERSIFNY